MDATLHIKKLDFIKNHPKLYCTKRIFETFGKIKKVWALSNYFIPENSSIHITSPSIKLVLRKPFEEGLYNI